MEIAHLVRDYLAVLVGLGWPAVALVAIIRYREVIEQTIKAVLPKAKVKLTLPGLSFEATIPDIEHSVSESLSGKPLGAAQLSLLKKLRDDGRQPFDRSPSSQEAARPLRNAGLIKSYPEGAQLANANEIELTTLGGLAAEAAEKRTQQDTKRLGS